MRWVRFASDLCVSQGFAMMQGVQTAERVRLLLDAHKHTSFHVHPRQKRVDTRKRK